MSVLIEAVCIVVRFEAIQCRFAGGWKAFDRDRPCGSICSDGDLVSVVFTAPREAQQFLAILEKRGLIFECDGQAVDIAVVDQLDGPTLPAPWLALGCLEKDGMQVNACWLSSKSPGEVSIPLGWNCESSLCAKPSPVTLGQTNARVGLIKKSVEFVGGWDRDAGISKTVQHTERAAKVEADVHANLYAAFVEVPTIEEKLWSFPASSDVKYTNYLLQSLTNKLLPSVLETAAKATNEAAFACFTAGLMLRILDRRTEAEQAFRKSNDLKPSVLKNLRELVDCLRAQERFHDALLYSKECVSLAPTDPSLWRDLAKTLIQCGQPAEARSAIDHAVRLESTNQIRSDYFDCFEKPATDATE